MSQYRVFVGPYFPVFGLNTERKSLYSVRIQENTAQKKVKMKVKQVKQVKVKQVKELIPFKSD